MNDPVRPTYARSPSPRVRPLSRSKSGDGCLTALGGLVAVGALLVVGAITRGIVLSILWRWFLVGQFHIMAISSAEAIGLSLLIGMLAESQSSDSEKTDDVVSAFVKAAGTLIGAPILTLGIGWIVLQFIH